MNKFGNKQEKERKLARFSFFDYLCRRNNRGDRRPHGYPWKRCMPDYDWTPKNQTIQQCKDGMTIYPSDYFCGYKHIALTYCEHLALGSWRNWDVCPTVQHAPGQFKRRIRKFLDRLLFIYSYVLIKVR